MRVFKFGGASVNSAESIRNVANILKDYSGERLVVVFSAMGKMTNAFEALVQAAWSNDHNIEEKIAVIESYHQAILGELFPDPENPAHNMLAGYIELVRTICQNKNFGFDEFYDRIVPFGELISTGIISAWFDDINLKNILIPAPTLIKTNSHFRDATVDWDKTCKLISMEITDVFRENPGHIVITQGFIGSTADGRRTTLGREGSDFTSSVFAFCLNAKEVVFWKDVDGLLNADPAFFENPVKIDHLSYKEAVELTFYGAKILHPKTIKPLQNKRIPLLIKSFKKPRADGSVIHESEINDTRTPFIILKTNQSLVSFSTRDFSFINEANLQRLFGTFHNHNIKINLMQNSAISFTVCINHPGELLQLLIDELKKDFIIKYNTGLELLTIRNFTEDLILKHTSGCRIFLEQRSRSTFQVAYSKR
jgi:aspartate kinase